jgi:hypothetical protein
LADALKACHMKVKTPSNPNIEEMIYSLNQLSGQLSDRILELNTVKEANKVYTYPFSGLSVTISRLFNPNCLRAKSWMGNTLASNPRYAICSWI